MTKLEKLNIGIVGAAGRPTSFKLAFEASNAPVRVHAVCDIDEERCQRARQEFGASKTYTDYDEMISKEDLDAVVIGTPMHLHAAQSIAALEQDIHVMSEVTAAVSIEECRQLVQVCTRSHAVYMMAENCNYMKPYMLIKELVKRGMFGEVYYAEGGYLHELKGLFEITKWRRKWQAGINGITYGTHSLGPILAWMKGDRVARVSCVGSGHHYTDSHGDKYENEDSCVMLAKTEQGRLIKIRTDIVSERPYGLLYCLQGTKGAYESARSSDMQHRVWLKGISKDKEEWTDLQILEDEYLPDVWQNIPEEIRNIGHGGSEYVVLMDFINAIVKDKQPDVGVHEAMDMTLPGLVSQESIRKDGEWLQVPDSRKWVESVPEE